MGVEDAGQGKLFKVIIDILEDLSLEVEDTKDALLDLSDGEEEIHEDLADLEEEFYDCVCEGCGAQAPGPVFPFAGYEGEDEDEDDDIFYSVKCPGCGAELTVDEDIVEDGYFECPECGEVIDFDQVDLEEVDFEDDEDEEDDD
jgi:ribosomal protein S27E